MTSIKTRCPNCHIDLVLEPYEVIVRIGPHPASAGYRFVCEACLARCELPLTARGVDLLTAAGASVIQITDDDPDGELITPAGRLSMAEALRFAHDLALTDYPQAELIDTD